MILDRFKESIKTWRIPQLEVNILAAQEFINLNLKADTNDKAFIKAQLDLLEKELAYRNSETYAEYKKFNKNIKRQLGSDNG